MKNLFVTSLLFCSLTVSLLAQEKTLPPVDNQTIANMSLDQLQSYQKVLQLQAKNQSELPSPDRIQEYALVGKALGQAFKECWSTVSTDAEKFAQSDAGKWTAFLITWKVMGKDAIDLVKTSVRWVVGCFILLIGVPFFAFFTWRNCITRKQVESVDRTSMFTWKKTYAKGMYVPEHCNEAALLYGVSFIIFLVVTALMMFV